MHTCDSYDDVINKRRTTSTTTATATAALATEPNRDNANTTYLIKTPRGNTAVTELSTEGVPYESFVNTLWIVAKERDTEEDHNDGPIINQKRRTISTSSSSTASTTYSTTSAAAAFSSRSSVCSVSSSISDNNYNYYSSCSDSDNDIPIIVSNKKQRNVYERYEYQQPQQQQQTLIQPSEQQQIQQNSYIVQNGKILGRHEYYQQQQQQQQQQHHHNFRRNNNNTNNNNNIQHVQLRLRLKGGMVDRQNRVGSKFGGGGVSSGQQSERERKERLRQLALETIDLAKDPYLMRNHLGTYECKLCLTLHTNEANYLSHTQGKKHQAGLAKRAYLEKLKQEQKSKISGGVGPMPLPGTTPTVDSKKQQPLSKRIKIGRPAYQVYKSRDPESNQRILSFEIIYTEISNNIQPRHRFMSTYEHSKYEKPDPKYQYLLIAAEPYETIAFKIPNEPICRDDVNKFVTNWNDDDKKFILTLYYEK